MSKFGGVMINNIIRHDLISCCIFNIFFIDAALNKPPITAFTVRCLIYFLDMGVREFLEYHIIFYCKTKNEWTFF